MTLVGRCRTRTRRVAHGGPNHASGRAAFCRSRDRASKQVRRLVYDARSCRSRFLEVDPIEGGSANDYDYVNADPINSRDLLGLANPFNVMRSWRARQAFRFFVRRGLTAAQAAGIIGNLQYESRMNPAQKQIGGGPGRGLAQWEIGGRWDIFVNYAFGRGKSPYDFYTQLNFIWHELTGTESAALRKLRATTNAREAALSFSTNYERAGRPNNEARMAGAERALRSFG